jgi:ATP-dependent RNA helicase SUPV3L1/SUV3
MSALSGAQHLASSGRTSFPVDKALHRDAYRVLGYRQCGERAVRVDILERLADLIRPALAWRETSPGEKPAGAFDGRGFVVTQAMTSLTGSAGEDFASVLRALGYRMDKRPPLPPKPVVVEAPAAEAAPAEAAAAEIEAVPVEAVAETPPVEAAAETPSVETAAETPSDVPAEEAATAQLVSGDPAPSAALLPEVSLAPAAAEEVPAAVEAAPEAIEAAAEPAAPVEAPAEEAPQEQVAAETTTASETTEAAAVVEAAPAEAAAAEAVPETPAVPELIEVWRPGGRSEERRPQRHDRNRPRHQGRQERAPEGAQPAAAVAGEAGEAAKPERHRHGRRDRHRDFRKPREGAPVEAVAAAAPAAEGAAPAVEARPDQGRPSRERFEGKGGNRDNNRDNDRNKGKFGGDRNKDRDRGGRDKGREFGKGGRDKGGRDSGPSHRQYATSAAPRERDRPIDPNSPFAKLAALKEQLAGNRKD